MYRSPKFLRNNSISQISNSTEKIKKGSAFFAISGANVDGNNFIPEAIKKGAKIIVSSKKSSLRKVKNNKIIKLYPEIRVYNQPVIVNKVKQRLKQLYLKIDL